MDNEIKILVDLIEAQTKALETSKSLIKLKSEIINILENELKIIKKHNIITSIILISLSSILAILLILSCL